MEWVPSIPKFLLTAILFINNYISAQSTAGITGKPDTSFTISSEYNKVKKNHPQIKSAVDLPSAPFKEKSGIPYCTINQRKLLLDVFYPSATTKKKHIAVMIIHGGGWRSGNRDHHHALAKRLTRSGYVTVTPEYRLSTEALYPAAVYDLKAALRWMHANAKKYNIDPSKIAVSGFSSGGQLATLIGTTSGNRTLEGNACNIDYPSTAQAIINLDGIVAFIHPESGEGDDSKKTSAATHWFGYSKKDNPEVWREASPLTHINKNTPPTLFINSSVVRMHAGRDDYIKILNAYDINAEVKTFEGAPHSFPLFQPWFDSTVKIIDNFLNKVFETKNIAARTLIIAQDGSGNYKTVQAALNAVPLRNKNAVTIFIKNGIYKEKLLLDSTKDFITLVGEDKFNTILTYDDHTGKIASSGDTINTRTSYSFKIKADNFTAENISFVNSAGFSAGQAVAVESNGDKAIFRDCRFIGNQDVLFTNNDNSRQYFENCYIEGTTDFIFGSSTAWFQQCHIQSKKNSHITAASTPAKNEHGYIFNDCILTGDTTLRGVSLGRPWRPYASVTYIHSYIGPHILPEGWRNWNNTDNYKTTRYFEYENYGPGAQPVKRVSWSRQLSAEDVKRYTIKNIFGDWNPLK